MDILNKEAQRAMEKARERAPGELWLEVSPGIFMASGRTPKSERQAEILEKELEQASLLAAQGHTVCLLLEQGPRGKKHPDAIVDGMVFEFKIVTGNIRKIAGNFKAARKKADNVFLKIDADFSQETVLEKLIGTVRRGGYNGGIIIAHFTGTGKTYYWNIEDLK
jgi:hypothetical protein